MQGMGEAEAGLGIGIVGPILAVVGLGLSVGSCAWCYCQNYYLWQGLLFHVFYHIVTSLSVLC